MGASTGTALFPPQTREVTTAIADHGGAIAGQPGPDQFSILTFLYPLACFWIDAFDQEGIGPGVHSIADFALAGHTRTEKFGHAKFIVGGDVEQLFQL